MAIWRKPLQFINVMLANRSPMSVTERGPGRMTYAKKKIKPSAEHDLRVTLQCAGNYKGTLTNGLSTELECTCTTQQNLRDMTIQLRLACLHRSSSPLEVLYYT